MTLLIERLWNLDTDCGPNVAGQCTSMTFSPSDTGRAGPSLAFTPGVMFGRVAISTLTFSCSGLPPSPNTVSAVSRMTFVEPDGTEHELVDKQSYANTISNPNSSSGTT